MSAFHFLKGLAAKPFRAGLRAAAGALALAVAFSLAGFAQPIGSEQAAPPVTDASLGLPEPIYWKQTLFQIPYQWASAAEPGAVQAVWLFVSKDRGATWHKISEAKPHVKSFTYRAETEGEYWFAVRTIDHQGRAWPAGEYQPELRVIVDTTMPRIETLQANAQTDGSVAIQWHGADQNLDPNSWKIEAQTDPLGNWQLVPAAMSMEQGWADPNSYAAADTAGVVSTGQTVWRATTGARPVAIRATVSDRAGNSATFQTDVKIAPRAATTFQRLPPTEVSSAVIANSPPASAFEAHLRSDALFSPPPVSPASPPGWMSASTATPAIPSNVAPHDQLWPVGTTARAPFRLSNIAPDVPSDAVTTYGEPSRGDSPIARSSDPNNLQFAPPITDRYALNSDSRDAVAAGKSSDDTSGPAFQPLPPFRQASAARPPESAVSAPTSAYDGSAAITPIDDNRPPLNAYSGQIPPDVQPKLVGSRTFALEYDLEQVGRWGVSNIELWGTRDGGQTWRCFARDDDQRSPLLVTVDDEGIYGFRIVVESSGAPVLPPSTGDEPELWIAVDLGRPVAALTAIEPGSGNLADHLNLCWQAVDNNLDSRPISLFYSSRPGGPWSAIATNLENTGQYAWRVERHVPTRFYVRLEARDSAGNLAAFQTREPIEFAPAVPSGQLRSAEPADPTAGRLIPPQR